MAAKVFINGHSVGTGGGYTVARELARYMAMARPDWEFSLGVIADHPLQSEFEAETFPDNCQLLRAPKATAGIRARKRYERGPLTERINSQGYSAVVQLNGMVLNGVKVPTLAHFQDPFPYRPEAWETLFERFAAWLKRRENRNSLNRAAVCGWTSTYLRDLICEHHNLKPKRSVVFYNGVPDEWVSQAAGELPSWDDRPMELVTVSHVWPYKRQSLVIEAVAKLRKIPGLENLKYRVIGGCIDDYQSELKQLAKRLGVEEAVSIEGRITDEEVKHALAAGRVMPLMSLCESFGIPTIEAMSYGTPVVIADCCALPEICGDAAMKVAPDDLDGLVATLKRLLTDEELVTQLRAKGAERVAHFQWSKIGAEMADVVESMFE